MITLTSYGKKKGGTTMFIKNTKWKKVLAAVLGLGLMAGALTGCGGGSQPSASSGTPTKIVAYGELDPQVSGQQIIAEEKGFFKEEGLDIENKLMNGPDDNAPLVASGEAKVCFGSIYNNISVAANGVHVKVVTPLANAAGTQAVVAGKNVTINSPKDLEGKRIGMTNGAGVLIAVQNMCKATGTDISKLQFVNLAPSEQLASLERGDIDALAAWEPWIGKAVQQGGKELFSGTKSYLPGAEGDVHWIDFYMTLQVQDDFLKQNPEAVEKMLRALRKATDYINEHPEESAKIVAKRINIDEETCLRIMKKNVYAMKFDQQFLDGANNMANFMKDMNNIQAVPDTKNYIDTSILKKIFPDDVTI